MATLYLAPEPGSLYWAIRNGEFPQKLTTVVLTTEPESPADETLLSVVHEYWSDHDVPDDEYWSDCNYTEDEYDESDDDFPEDEQEYWSDHEEESDYCDEDYQY